MMPCSSKRARSIDSLRCVIEGLGRVAAAQAAPDIVSCSDSDSYSLDKLASATATALARMLRFCDLTQASPEVRRDSTIAALRAYIVKHEHGGQLDWWDIYKEMRHLRAWHADTLIGKWLSSGRTH